MELQILFHRINMVEDVIDNSWNNSLHSWVIDDTLHGVSLTRRRLSISKYGSIVSTKNICVKNTKSI